MLQEAQEIRLLPEDCYELTWFFEYTDGRKKKGIYGHAGKGKDTAFAQSKINLHRAGIYARCGRRVERLVIAVDHSNFCNFEWAASRTMLGGITTLTGLTLVTPEQRITISKNGCALIEPRDNTEDKLFHYGR